MMLVIMMIAMVGLIIFDDDYSDNYDINVIMT
jgi:hypothetical protein